METFKTKKIMLVFLLVILIMLLPTRIFAATQSVAIVKVENDYSIYIDGLENKDFKFTFTNQNPEDETSFESQLIPNWEDNNGVNIACLEDDTNLDLNEPIFMIIEVGGELSVTELDLNKAISKTDMASVEALTTIIDVDTTQTTTTTDNENGVVTTQTVGQVNIIESSDYNYEDYEYQYNLIKIDGTESETATKLSNLVDSLQSTYSKLSTYNKILKTSEVRDLYNSLKEEATYSDVNDFVIYQPEDSKEGDKYLVLLQQLSGGKIVREDIQFLICTEGHKQEVVKEVKEIKKATALPRTFDSIVLLVVFAVILIIAIAVILRIRKLNKNEE